MASETQRTVELQRTVRYGPLLIGGAVLGGVIASGVTLLFPVQPSGFYTMGQIAGFMLLIGGAAGLVLAGILALVLTVVARRKRGSGVVVAHTVTVVEAEAEMDAGAGAEVEAAGPAAPGQLSDADGLAQGDAGPDIASQQTVR